MINTVGIFAGICHRKDSRASMAQFAESREYISQRHVTEELYKFSSANRSP
jgi:hypothetical protein